MAVNLYSNKQKWKIALMLLAFLMVAAFLFVSNTIVSKVGEREKERARQWADAIKKKLELVQLTNRTFSQLRDKERKEMTLWIDATKEVSKASPLDIDPNLDFPFKIKIPSLGCFILQKVTILSNTSFCSKTLRSIFLFLKNTK